jgi:phage-related protein
VFGLKRKGVQLRRPLDRWDLEAIATWLTGPDGYRKLEIEQGDLDTIHYKCMISELRQIAYAWETFALSCRVRCDSPYAYTDEYKFRYVVNLGLQDELYNRSTHCGFYLPKIKILGIGSGLQGRSVSIKNLTDGGRETLLANIPAGVSEILLDQQRGVITNNAGENLYDNFNFQFCRLLRGRNILQFSGRFTAEFCCEFPVNMGV